MYPIDLLWIKRDPDVSDRVELLQKPTNIFHELDPTRAQVVESALCPFDLLGSDDCILLTFRQALHFVPVGRKFYPTFIELCMQIPKTRAQILGFEFIDVPASRVSIKEAQRLMDFSQTMPFKVRLWI